MRERLAHLSGRASVWALAGLLVTLPMWRHRVLFHRPGDPVFFEFHDITRYTNDLFWWAAIGAWLLSRWLRADTPRLRPGPWFLTMPLAGLLALSLAGIPFAVDPVYAAYQTVRLALLGLLYLMVINSDLTAAWVAWPFAASMVLQMAVALPQFALGRSLGLGLLGEVSVQAAWPGASVVMVGEERWLRAYGLTQHPNLLGGCLMVMLLVVAGHYVVQAGWRRTALLVAIGSGLVALLLTFSRAAWLGTAIGALMMSALLLWICRQGRWAPRKGTIPLLAGLILVVCVAFVAINWTLLQPRLGLTRQGVEIRSIDARAMQVEAALALARIRPLLGVGIGNYPTALYRLARDMVAAYPVYQPVHDVLLLSAVELGFVGGALWLFLIVAPWAALWVRRRHVKITVWWAGLGGALLALTVVSFFDAYPWSSHQGRLALWLVWGLWAREWVSNGPRETSAWWI